MLITNKQTLGRQKANGCRIKCGMTRLAFLSSLVLMACLALMGQASPLNAQIIKGLAYIIDGDSLVIDDKPIRLFGIDAPELKQNCYVDGVSWACGQAAKAYLTALVADGALSCQTISKDQYQRMLAICYDMEGHELNRSMVASGHAIAYLTYSRLYLQEEMAAKSQRLGIWQDPDFILPYQWRKMNHAR